jgi:hypothetical protein
MTNFIMRNISLLDKETGSVPRMRIGVSCKRSYFTMKENRLSSIRTLDNTLDTVVRRKIGLFTKFDLNLPHFTIFYLI